jgi:hypothetical protein
VLSLQRRLKLSGVGIGQKWSNGILLARPIASAANQKVRKLGSVQVHHIFPFHDCVALGRPDLELDERNLITLCGKSHNGIGENHRPRPWVWRYRRVHHARLHP